jgi:hypothetical protein
MERRPAAIHFPLSAKHVAPCYRPLANGTALGHILSSNSDLYPNDDIPEALVLFRVLSAAIVLSIIARFDGSTFETVSHSTY